MLGLTSLRRIMHVAVLLLGVSASVFAGSVTITSPNNLALFQHTNGVANIPVTAVATDVPTGGGLQFVLDQGTSSQLSGVTFSTPYSYIFQNVSLGEHTLDVYMIDSNGNPLGPQDSRSRIGVGDEIICVGDSITAGEDDNITSDDWSADGRNGPYVDPIDGLSFGGFEPILNNLLTAATGYPHSVINQGMGTETSTGGLSRLPGIIAKYSTADTWLIAYGTNDIHVGISPSTFEHNLSEMVAMIQAANPNAVVYMPKILYGGQSNIGTYQDSIGDLIYYRGLHWGADMYTMFQSNLNTYDRMTAQPGTWYAVDNVPHPNGIGYQQIAKLWELAIDHNAFIVADGTAQTVGRIQADKIQLTGADNIGLSENNLLLVCAQPPAQAVPTGTYYPNGGWSVYLRMTGATNFSTRTFIKPFRPGRPPFGYSTGTMDFSQGTLTATVRLEPWDLFNSGASSWNDIWLSSNGTLLPTTRTVYPLDNNDEEFTATVAHIGQLVPVVK